MFLMDTFTLDDVAAVLGFGCFPSGLVVAIDVVFLTVSEDEAVLEVVFLPESLALLLLILVPVGIFFGFEVVVVNELPFTSHSTLAFFPLGLDPTSPPLHVLLLCLEPPHLRQCLAFFSGFISVQDLFLLTQGLPGSLSKCGGLIFTPSHCVQEKQMQFESVEEK